MDDKDRIIEELRTLVAAQAEQLKQQAARIAELELALAKATKDSSTSSKSPSSDIVNPKPKPAKRSRKKPRRGHNPGTLATCESPYPPNESMRSSTTRSTKNNSKAWT